MFLQFEGRNSMERPLYINTEFITALREITPATTGIYTTGGQHFVVSGGLEETANRINTWKGARK